MTHTVRTTQQPDVEIEVGDAEYLDLHRQGLLLDEQKPQRKPPPRTVVDDKETS